MPDSIDDLKNEAVKKAHESGKLEDIERAASVYKLAADAQKSSAEAATQKSALRQEGLKNWAQILVPLLSVLALAATLWNQDQQLRETQRSKEDEGWRAAIAEFRNANNSKAPVADLLPQVRLKPFLRSPVYGEQANQLARLILPRIADPDGFRDLFESVKWNDLNEIAGVLRNLNHIDDLVRARSDKLNKPAVETGGQPTPPGKLTGALPGLPGGAAFSKVLEDRGKEERLAQQREEIDAELTEIGKKMTYVCNRMADAARSGRLSSSSKLDLEEVYFFNCNLSKVDLRGAILTRAGFQAVSVEGARLADAKDIDGLTLSNTAWWQASDISAPLLKELMDLSDPGSESQKDLVDKPTKEEYLGRVATLCKGARIDCPVSSIKFSVARKEN